MATLLVLACGCSGSPQRKSIAFLPPLRIEGHRVADSQGKIIPLDLRKGTARIDSDAVPEPDGGVSLIEASRHALAGDVLIHAWAQCGPPFYLAGRRPDGSVEALPLFVDPEVEEALQRTCGPLDANDLLPGFGFEGIMDLRIERKRDVVRYRWGHARDLKGVKPFDEGDAVLPVSEVGATGAGPLLPGLVSTFTHRRAVRAKGRTLVRLEVSHDTCVVDLLRAVECTGGGRDVLFLPPFSLRRAQIQRFRLPAPGGDDGHYLREVHVEWKPHCQISVYEDPERKGRVAYHVRGRETALKDIHPTTTVWLYVNRDIPFRAVQPILKASEGAGVEVDLIFDKAEVGFWFERKLKIPWANHRDSLAVKLGAVFGPRRDWVHRSVRLIVPGGAAVGGVWQAALKLLRDGIAGLEFHIEDS